MEKGRLSVRLKRGEGISVGSVEVTVGQTNRGGGIQLIIMAPKDLRISRVEAKRDKVQREGSQEAGED